MKTMVFLFVCMMLAVNVNAQEKTEQQLAENIPVVDDFRIAVRSEFISPLAFSEKELMHTDQLLFLEKQCVGIAHGVRPGPLIQKFMEKNLFLNGADKCNPSHRSVLNKSPAAVAAGNRCFPSLSLAI